MAPSLLYVPIGDRTPHRTAPHLNLAAESVNAKSADDNGSSRCHEARWIQRVVGILELPGTPDNFLGRRRAHRDRTHRRQPRGICRSCTATTGGSRTSRRCQRRPGFEGGAVSCSRRVVLAPRANGRDGGRASSPIRRVGEIARHSRIGRSSMRRVVAVIVRGHPCATRHPFRLAGLTALEFLRKVGLLALNDDDDDETSGKKSLLIVGGAGGGGGKLDDFPGAGVASLPGDHGHGVHNGTSRYDTKKYIAEATTTRRRGRWIRWTPSYVWRSPYSRPIRILRGRYTTERFHVFGRRREELSNHWTRASSSSSVPRSLYFHRSGPSSDTSSPPKNYGSFWNSPVLPDLVSGRVWEDSKEDLSETGVLHGLGSDLRTTREVRYENRSRRFIGAVSELAPRVECMSRMIRTKVVKLG